MLRFQHIEYLWFLLAIPLLIFLYVSWLRLRKKKLQQVGDLQLVEALIPAFDQKRTHLKFTLICTALFFGVIALANLQSGARSEKVQRKGIDVMIALDVSKSMLAKDVSPDRLGKARQFISHLLEKLSSNRIGLIVFAGKAYASVPLTVDISALKMNLNAATPDLVPTQGTVLGEAIGMARQSFNTKETKYKSIVLISDGEDHDESAIDEVKKAVAEGIMVNTVGVGSADGSPIWDADKNENKKDQEGNEIISKLNEAELQNIAQSGQGIYRHLTNTESASQAIADQINTIEQKSFGDSLFVDYNSYFQYFLVLSLLLFIIDVFIQPGKKLIAA
ncbi:MAG: VWA domain-containing protein [Chitinophagaceae bacterium]|nr:VWA domain-containing protein [Chitinophagaceae bacterium]